MHYRKNKLILLCMSVYIFSNLGCASTKPIKSSLSKMDLPRASHKKPGPYIYIPNGFEYTWKRNCFIGICNYLIYVKPVAYNTSKTKTYKGFGHCNFIVNKNEYQEKVKIKPFILKPLTKVVFNHVYGNVSISGRSKVTVRCRATFEKIAVKKPIKPFVFIKLRALHDAMD